MKKLFYGNYGIMQNEIVNILMLKLVMKLELLSNKMENEKDMTQNGRNKFSKLNLLMVIHIQLMKQIQVKRKHLQDLNY